MASHDMYGLSSTNYRVYNGLLIIVARTNLTQICTTRKIAQPLKPAAFNTKNVLIISNYN